MLDLTIVRLYIRGKIGTNTQIL